MWQQVHGALYFVNKRMPDAKRLVPAGLRRRLAAALDGRTVPNEPDRLYLKDVIFPAMQAARPRVVLFVGCRGYTKPYEQFFQGAEYWTLEIEPEYAKWGARLHKVGDVKLADTLFPPGHFDTVIFNGVFGFGVNQKPDMEQALRALHAIMQPGATMLLGWDENRCPDPLGLPALQAHFAHEGAYGLPARKGFEDSPHVYDFLRAKRS